MRHYAFLLLTVLAAGCGPTSSDLADRQALAAARPIGEPVNCLPLQAIQSTRVRDDQTIDFIMRGREVYRNRLPHACPSLGYEEAFSYRTSQSQLCSIDIITVLPRGGGGIRGASCGLGAFQPIAPPAR